MRALDIKPRTVFASPGEQTAPAPPEARGLARDAVRLLVATGQGISHTTFRRIGAHLRRGDVLVVNTSATVPGQLDGYRRGGRIVVHIANRLEDGARVVELRSAPDASTPILEATPGERVDLVDGGSVELIDPYPRPDSSPTGTGNRLWRGVIRVPGRLDAYLSSHARPISYGYLRQTYPIEAYQTVFAIHPGSAEMPSAGRPFTPDLVSRLAASGVDFAPITLHTGVSSQDAGEAPQEEWFEVTPTSADLVNAARRRGGRVVAVGTTATRALESAARPDGTVMASSGWTDLVISPERPVRTLAGLVTGWHNPEASHLLLVEAVAGPELTQRAYDAAVAGAYLWHEFGDSCLLLPRHRGS
jgi:S-adenosylmethionine:tRNA ribosyltransferase-isomerase